MNHWLFLIPIFFSFGTSSGKDEECLCIDTIKSYVIDTVNLSVTTYMTEESPLTINLLFHDNDDDLNKDFISVKSDYYEITKFRDPGGENTERFNLSSPIPLGWVNLNVNVKKKEVYITPFIDKILADYPVKTIVVASKHMAACNKGTPSWKITKDHLVTIPLNVLGTSRISITSSKEFSPVIKIYFLYDMNHILKNQSGLIIVPTGSKMQGNIFRYIIENNDNIIRVTPEDKECDGPIASLNQQTILKNITASSLDEDFTLTLEPTVNHTTACTTKMSDPLTITLGVSTAICAGLCLILIIIIISIWRKRKNNTSIVSEIDESDLPLKSNQGEIHTQTVSEILENEQTPVVSGMWRWFSFWN